MPTVDEIIAKRKDGRLLNLIEVDVLVAEIERLRAEIDERWQVELELRRYIGITLTLAFQDDSNGIRRELNHLARIRELEAQVASARKDSERLDWLDSTLSPRFAYLARRIPGSSGNPAQLEIQPPAFGFPDSRSAIDAIRLKELDADGN